MKILHLDIETAPNTAHVWGKFGQDIADVQMVEAGYTLCWAAKWDDKRTIMFSSVQETTPRRMIKRIHTLVDEADVVVHYNGNKFDMPTLNKDFIVFGLPPPAPYESVDLFIECKQFKFPSRKLNYILATLEVGRKTPHKGHELWKECMKGKGVTKKQYEAAWRIMKQYNKNDVVETAKLYYKVLAWIRRHPNWNVYNDDGRSVCVNCGSSRLHNKGWKYTRAGKYKRFICRDCGKYVAAPKTVISAETKKSKLMAAN